MEPVNRSASSRVRFGSILAILGRLVLGLGSLVVVSFAVDGSLEYRVKAAFLLNFVKFTEWPATAFTDADSPIAICVFGDDPFGTVLDQLTAGETVSKRRVVVQRPKRAPVPKTCNVLFFSGSQKEAGKILPSVGPGVLTVGEGDGFAHYGGMITFVIDSGRVRFDINVPAAEGAGLKLSSKLLSVARSLEK
jgi:YfiR/HmsC-like